MRKAKKASYAENEELINLAVNTFGLRSLNELERMIGLSGTNANKWRSSGELPIWIPLALNGLLATKNEVVNIQTGMLFTDSQLDMLNMALAAAELPASMKEDMRTVRAAVLKELAKRLEKK